jgi:hypothetical protein
MRARPLPIKALTNSQTCKASSLPCLHCTLTPIILFLGCSAPCHLLTTIPRLQDDIVYDDLTVRENLAYSAHLRQPPGTPNQKVGFFKYDFVPTFSIMGVDKVVGTGEDRDTARGGAEGETRKGDRQSDCYRHV